MPCWEGDMVATIVAVIAASQQVEAGDVVDATVSFSGPVSSYRQLPIRRGNCHVDKKNSGYSGIGDPIVEQ